MDRRSRDDVKVLRQTAYCLRFYICVFFFFRYFSFVATFVIGYYLLDLCGDLLAVRDSSIFAT